MMEIKRSARNYRIAVCCVLVALALGTSLHVAGVSSVWNYGWPIAAAAFVIAMHFAVRLILAALATRTRQSQAEILAACEERADRLRDQVAWSAGELRALRAALDAFSVQSLAERAREGASMRRSVAVIGETTSELTTRATARFDAIDQSLVELRTANLEAFGASRVRSERIPQAVVEYSTMHRRLAADRISMPLAGDWAMTVGVLAQVVSEILASHDGANVVELGSGVSTVWASLAVEERGAGRVVSLEHSPKYLSETRELLQRFGVPSNVTMSLAPLVDTRIDTETYRWYDTSVLEDELEIDVLVVDGPPGRLGDKARYPAFPVLKSRLRAGAMIVVDDTIRVAERNMANDWLALDPALKIEKVLEKSTILRWAPGAP